MSAYLRFNNYANYLARTSHGERGNFLTQRFAGIQDGFKAPKDTTTIDMGSTKALNTTKKGDGVYEDDDVQTTPGSAIKAAAPSGKLKKKLNRGV
jgi:hypothetical protein